jgi:Ca2+/Na+ antiporter
MTTLGFAAETPLRTASRIFGAVIITVALLVGILALVRPTAAQEPSIAPVPLVSLNTDNHGLLLIGHGQTVGLQHES